MQRKASVVISLVVLFATSSANASPKCVVFSSQAQGLNGKLVSLQVGKGHGLNANFIPTGETIEKVWIDDQSQVGISFDGNLCQWTSSQQAECSNSGATVIHLRQTKLINFPDLPRSQNGSTLLSAITQGESGRKLYQFTVTPVKNAPACSSMTILPDPQRLDPLLPTSVSQNSPSRSSQVPTDTSNSSWQQETTVPGASTDQAFTLVKPAARPPDSSTQAPASINPRQQLSTNSPAATPKKQTSSTSPATTTSPTNAKAISDANAAVRGLEVAKRKNQITPQTTIWKKTQSAIIWLRRGMNPHDAANRANIPASVLTQLIAWGQQ